MKIVALIHNVGQVNHEDEVMERAQLWADDIIVYSSDSYTAQTRAEAWNELELKLVLSGQDMVVLLRNDEVMVEHERLRQICKGLGEYRLQLNVVTMWTRRMYRSDAPWSPHEETRIIPYRPFAQFEGKIPLPTYAYQIPLRAPAVGTVLSYQFEPDTSKVWWHDRWKTLDYHTHEYRTILKQPSLVEWNSGGLIHA
jgi:hypothetical protein